MPYSMDEMRREMEGMGGEGFLFSIFPTETVKNNMGASGVKASDSQVERLWTSYQKATIDNGLAPFSHAAGGAVAGPLMSFMSADTGYDRLMIAAWLNAVETAVTTQGWDWKWLDPAGARDAGQPLSAGESVSQALSKAGQGLGGFLKPTLDPVTNLVKYTAIAVVAGAVIYGVYHGSKLIRTAKKAARRKG